MSEYPASLRYVKVDVGAMVEPKLQELQGMSHFHVVEFDADALETGFESLDLSNMHDQWYRRFSGGSYYCGILNLEPWDLLDRYMEEEIWELLVREHLDFDTEYPWTVTFRHNDESPIGKWLRRYTSYGDVATNVESVFRNAVQTVFALDEGRHESELWNFLEEGYCPKCECWTVGTGRWFDCGHCGTALTGGEEEEGD